jgi:hypothetical protein
MSTKGTNDFDTKYFFSLWFINRLTHFQYEYAHNFYHILSLDET